ncbi:MAG: OmpA family protein [Syntrophaceae bacterium]|nr:OmpA family protein [Syntrophaceae bacterium]
MPDAAPTRNAGEEAIGRLPLKKAAATLRFQKKSPPADAGNEIWLLTLTDVFMLLMVCFVLLFGLSLQKQKETAAAPPAAVAAPAERAPQDADILEKELLAAAGRDVTVEKRAMQIVLTFPERILFDSGQAEVRGDVGPLLERLAAVIRSRPALAVAIHGHTDDRPIRSRRYASNWELSVERATQVARALVGMGIEPARLSIRGFGDERPLAANDSDENRTRNRRVEIQFSLAQPG